jgi:site-specific DNA-methyltransferase (adenine-specific)
MAPGLQTPERIARGKSPTDVWWHTIVPTTGREKTGYPTQKPEGVVRRIVAASSRPGGWCLDFFAGSGTLGAVCRELGRRYVLVDENPAAVDVARARLAAPRLGAPLRRTSVRKGFRAGFPVPMGRGMRRLLLATLLAFLAIAPASQAARVTYADSPNKLRIYDDSNDVNDLKVTQTG